MKRIIIILILLHLSLIDAKGQLALNLSSRKDSVKTTWFSLGLIDGMQRLSGVGVNAIFNLAKRDAKGLQLGGLANTAHNVKGAQISAISNMASGTVTGLQLSAITNTAVATHRGLQLSGIANVTTRKMRGVQMAYGNYAGEVNGLQLGLLNICGGEVKGIQIGLVNCSKDTTAHKLGLVSITPQTRIQMMTFLGNTCKTNLAVRFKNRYTYTILGGGTHYLDLNDKFSGSLFYRAGTFLPLTSRLELSGDLGFFHIENFENESMETPERMYSLQARVNLEYKLRPKFSLFASGGYGVTRYYDENRNYERKPIFEAGILLF